MSRAQQAIAGWETLRVDLFEAVGFRWDRLAVPPVQPGTVKRALWRFSRSLPEFVWDAAMLEGNPFTYPEVQTLMEGVTVGGRKLSDERQILNLAAASRRLGELVSAQGFALTKAISDELHGLIAIGEALEHGHFRGEGTETATPRVYLGEFGELTPPTTEPGAAKLRIIHADGLRAIGSIESPFEQALVYCLFGCITQFYFDGNKRTSRAMMNGHLMMSGIDAISVPARRRVEYNSLMTDFYYSRNADGMIAFFHSCLQLDPGAG
jgi:Fic family protein